MRETRLNSTLFVLFNTSAMDEGEPSNEQGLTEEEDVVGASSGCSSNHAFSK